MKQLLVFRAQVTVHYILYYIFYTAYTIPHTLYILTQILHSFNRILPRHSCTHTVIHTLYTHLPHIYSSIFMDSHFTIVPHTINIYTHSHYTILYNYILCTLIQVFRHLEQDWRDVISRAGTLWSPRWVSI